MALGTQWSSDPTGYPGCAPNDSATDVNLAPTIFIIHDRIPYPLIGLFFNTNSSSGITFEAGGYLGLVGPGVGIASLDLLAGGEFEIGSGGDLALPPQVSVLMSGGQLSIDAGGQVEGLVDSSGGYGSIVVDGTLSLAGSFYTSTIAGSGVTNLASYTMTVGGSNSDDTYDGLFSGTGGLTKTGSGTLYLTGNSTSTGPLTIDAGTVVLTGTWSGPIILNGGSFVGPAPSSTPEPGTASLLAISPLVASAIVVRRRRRTARTLPN